jgi:hypothetical protein
MLKHAAELGGNPVAGAPYDARTAVRVEPIEK